MAGLGSDQRKEGRQRTATTLDLIRKLLASKASPTLLATASGAGRPGLDCQSKGQVRSHTGWGPHPPQSSGASTPEDLPAQSARNQDPSVDASNLREEGGRRTPGHQIADLVPISDGIWGSLRRAVHVHLFQSTCAPGAGRVARRGDPSQCRGRICGTRSAPWKPEAGGPRPSWPRPQATPSLPAAEGRGPGAPHAGLRQAGARRWRLPRQEASGHGLCRPLRPHPRFGESDSGASPHRLTSCHTPGARGEITGLQGHS
ncbi:uncharacterized protein LOC121486771 [Vulpes lagopus]|uniref:uncharacterized protein LOC121486771 n=1 Tax=Vulpes lagopus TaxID=494514 RepID=UPI001BC924FD|nr:uncharacterized protein LOC121486771 [Vulpes lagopus]